MAAGKSSTQSQTELEQIKHQHNLILQAAGEGIYGLDCEGKTTFVNPAAARMLGWEADVLIGKPMHSLHHHSRPDGTPFPRKECPIYAAFKDGAVHHVENEVFWRKDGSSFPVEYTSTPITESGKLLGAVVVFKDISERKQAVDVLRKAEERFRLLFDNSSDALFLAEPMKEGRIIDCNLKACELLGYTRKELMTMQLSDVHPHEMTKFIAFAESVVSNGYGQTDELTCLTNNGEKVPAEISSSFFIDTAGSPLLLASVRDITERKQSQAALERLMKQNELILSAAGEGIYGIDVDGLATFANPAAVEMAGWTLEDIIGKPTHELHHHTRPDGSPYPREECPIYAAFRDGKIHHCEDEVFWRKDGSSFPVEYTSTPIVENGELAGAVVVFKDITGRKQAEQELLQAYAEVEQMKERLEAENVYLQEEIKVDRNFAGIVGQSHAIQQVLHQVELVAPTDASVLISGESGTGKELIACAIHEQSSRHERPLIRVNCAAIPRELFESEFFGHVKGAFTGALKDRTGRFELADGGTIFLDEVGEIPMELQSKLLRVLQEGQFERVGEEKTRTIDVRVVAASNRDLKSDIEARRFREDLFFRLNVFPIEAVPLRGRVDDIPLLASHFITLVSRRLNRPEPNLTQANLKQLQAYRWPGNIRELQNVVERAIIISEGKRLQFSLQSEGIETDAVYNGPAGEDAEGIPFTETERLARDRANILTALRLTNGKMSGEDGAAELLGIKPTTLASRMKSLGVEKSK